MSDRDGDSKLEEIRQKVEAGEEINLLDLIFLPLMKTKERRVDQLKRTIDIERELGLEQNRETNVLAMTLAVVDKFLDEREISEIWRDYKMLKIFKHAEEKGIEKGERKRDIEVAKNLLKEGVEIDIIAKSVELSKEEIKGIQKGMEH